MDAGIFPSHIGFESAVSADNPTLTSSLLAENSPYYLAGAKLSWAPSGKWELAALVLNGWQRIQRVPDSSLPSLGTQVTYSPSPATTLHWSTFIGTDDPDPTRRMRYFNNLYGQFQLSPKVSLITGFDVGVQQQAKWSPDLDLWLSPVAIGRLACRGEYYQDKRG